MFRKDIHGSFLMINEDLILLKLQTEFWKNCLTVPPRHFHIF